MRRWLLAACFAASLVHAGAGAQGSAPAAPKVLRYAFPAAETGFDPTKITDLYSRVVTAHVFDAPYRYDYLARPFKLQPNTAAAMPEHSEDFTAWTIRIKPGIYFTDDPAFKGRRRELVAQDYVYAWKRFFDPANKSPVFAQFNELGFVGMAALREEALKQKKPFDYDREVDGLRAVDRHTLQLKFNAPRPRLLFTIADNSLYGAVAREVVEFYGDAIAEHPVGTGPFVLTQWRRSSQLVLDRNPGFREMVYDAEPAPDDAEGQALLQRLRGRRLPMIDRVEVSIIEESQPRWLAFLNGQFDLSWPVPLEFSTLAVPEGRLAPHLAKRGIALHRIVAPDRTLTYFNMEDPVLGGLGADKVALRRALSLATDVGREIQIVRRGQAVPAQSLPAPATWGYDPDYKTENSDFDLPRAKALLDMFGYVDRDGDGWRDLPDGRPLVIRYASQPDAISRAFAEIWKKNMDGAHIRLQVVLGQWPEQLRAARAGQLMLWELGYTATSPDVHDALVLLYGPESGGQNLARFKHARFDEIVRQMQSLPDGPERLALLREAQTIITAYAPHKYNVHRIVNDLTQPWLVGFRRPLFGNQFWHWVDIDNSKRPTRR